MSAWLEFPAPTSSHALRGEKMQPYEKGQRKFKLRRGRRRNVNDAHDNTQTDREMLERLMPISTDNAFVVWYRHEFGVLPSPYRDEDMACRSAFEAGRKLELDRIASGDSLPLNQVEEEEVAPDPRQYEEPDGNDWIFEQYEEERFDADYWLPVEPRFGRHRKP
jgi:hypothetical protein